MEAACVWVLCTDALSNIEACKHSTWGCWLQPAAGVLPVIATAAFGCCLVDGRAGVLRLSSRRVLFCWPCADTSGACTL